MQPTLEKRCDSAPKSYDRTTSEVCRWSLRCRAYVSASHLRLQPTMPRNTAYQNLAHHFASVGGIARGCDSPQHRVMSAAELALEPEFDLTDSDIMALRKMFSEGLNRPTFSLLDDDGIVVVE